MRRTASSISASVVVGPRLKRSELATISFGRPIALSVGESSLDPLAHAEPTEQATPAMSRATSNTCASSPGKAMLLVCGSARRQRYG